MPDDSRPPHASPGGFSPRPRADLGVPPLGLVSDRELARAEGLLVVHMPRRVTRAFCLACRSEWPCAEVRFARVITAGQAVWGGHGT